MSIATAGRSAFVDNRANLTPEQLAEVASHTSLKLDILSKRGSLSAVRHLGFPGSWMIDAGEMNGHVRAWGGLDAGQIAVFAVHEPSEATICHVPMQERTVLFMPGGCEIAASILPGLRFSTVLTTMEQWSRIEEIATGVPARAMEFPRGIRLDAARWRQAEAILSNLADSIARSRRHSPGRLPAAIVDYLGLIAEARAEILGPTGRDEGPPLRVQQAWNAAEYIREHLEDDLSIVGLCRLVNASRRQLEYSFSSVFGVSPRRFIEIARLNESRRRLRSARAEGHSVTDIAMETGISHLGRFSLNYRRLFGERPRDTLLGGVAN